MKIVKGLMVIVLLFLYNNDYAQFSSLYSNKFKRLFLQSSLDIEVNLQYYNISSVHYKMRKNIPNGYSIKDNLTVDAHHEKFVKLRFQNINMSKDSIMAIDLYLDNMPDTINYYINISKFKVGYKKIRISPNQGKKTNMVIENMGQYFYKDGIMKWPEQPICDITTLVFPMESPWKKQKKIND